MCNFSLLGKTQSLPQIWQMVCTFLCSIIASAVSNSNLHSLTEQVLWMVLTCLLRAWAELNILLHSGHSLGLDECVSGCSFFMCFISSSSETALVSHNGQEWADSLMAFTWFVISSILDLLVTISKVLKSTFCILICDHRKST